MAREEFEQTSASQALSAVSPSDASGPDAALPGTLALPVISLVIPTHNRRASLRMVLEALSQQTIPADQYEVLVICDGCTDGSAEMCRTLRTTYRLRLFEQLSNLGPAASRNRGVQEAAAPLILFIDDDVVPDPILIAEHLRLHEQDERAVVIGPLLAPPNFRLNPWTRWEEMMLVKQYDGMIAGKWEPTPRQFYTGNASVRREHILAAGGFDAQFRRAEDVELAYRFLDQGLRFYFNAQARGWHHVRRSLRSWLRIPAEYGWADVAINTSKPRVLENMGKEFHRRQRRLRQLARACVGRPLRLRLTVGALLIAARCADWVWQPRLADAAYSAIFNLRYWQSVSEQIGGRAAFWQLIEKYRPTPAR